MKAELMKRLFRAIFSEDIISIKKIACAIIQDERQLGHNILADSLENLIITEKRRFPTYGYKKNTENDVATLPTSKRTNDPLFSFVSREQLKHHMILPLNVEMRLQSIEKEYVAKERLSKYNLMPKQKILLYGVPGCGKTLSAERIAWNLGLPLLKVRFDSLLSSYFGESASNLRTVFEYCKREPVVMSQYETAPKSSRRWLKPLVISCSCVLATVLVAVVIVNSPLFMIEATKESISPLI